MTTAAHPTPSLLPDFDPTWRQGYQNLTQENIAPVPLVTEGHIPAELRGTLYRNGPAQFDVHGERLHHPLDGDGMVHAYALQNGQVHYQNRFVQTAGKVREDAAGRRLYAGLGGLRPPGVAISDRKNPANSYVVRHGATLFALGHAGMPYRLDPRTLATRGVVKAAHAPMLFSTHPKRHGPSGRLIGFGVDPFPFPSLSIYSLDGDGSAIRLGRVPMPYRCLVHDFALTATRAVFVFTPLCAPMIPLQYLLNRQSINQTLRYQPERGAFVVTFDLKTCAVVTTRMAPMLVTHVINAWDTPGGVDVDVCAYDDARVYESAATLLAGDLPARVPARMRRIITGGGAATVYPLRGLPLEYPSILPRAAHRATRVVFGLSSPTEHPLAAVPTRIDLSNGTVTCAALAPGEYAGECIAVAKQGSRHDDEAWLLSVVLNGARQRSELCVFDGADLAQGAIGRAILPNVIPFGLHGSWSGI